MYSCFLKQNDIIFDPFVGTGSTGCAAVFHNRRFVGIDISSDFLDIARTRISNAIDGTLKTRPIGMHIQKASINAKTRQIPKEWKEVRDEQTKKPRLYPQWKKEDE